MLHRMALRVLPSLTLAVTEASVRKEKRIVMLIQGLAAFAVYRLGKWVVPLNDPLVLLSFSACLAAGTALVQRSILAAQQVQTLYTLYTGSIALMILGGLLAFSGLVGRMRTHGMRPAPKRR